jgi:predicted dehydrogenase
MIAGLGSIGRRHLSNLLQLGVREILLYRTRAEPLKEAPELPVFTDLAQALAIKPTIVLVSNPTAYHLPLALTAARAGCHLFVEKPLSNSWDGVEELISIIRQNHLITLVGFDLRFDQALCQVKDLIEDGCIGRCLSIQAQVGQYLPDWHPWEDYRQGMSARTETGGGVILDLVHELDYVTWLFGPVSEIFCFAQKVSDLDIQTEDTAVMSLKFNNGALGTIHLDYLQRVPSRTCRIIGERGTIVWDYFAQKVTCYSPSKKDPWEFEYARAQRNDRFLAEMRHLVDCVEGRDRPKVDIVSGSDTLKLALAAKRSAATGKVCHITD